MTKITYNRSWQLALILFLALPNLVCAALNMNSKTVAAAVLSLLFMTGILRLIRHKPFFLLIASGLIAVAGYVDLVHLLDYDAHISVGAVGAIFDTDPKEASEFFLSVSPTTLPLLALFITVAVLLLHFFPAGITSERSRKYWFATFLMILIPFADFVAKGSSRNAFPLSTVKAGIDYLGERSRLKMLLAERDRIHCDARRAAPFTQREHYLLILGESVRRDHLQQYGYPRETSPRLAARKDLLTFTDAVSPANQTRRAVKMMLSPATPLDSDAFYTHGSIITMAKEAGFKTQWLSNQGRYGKHDTEVSSIGREADYCVFTNTDWQTKSLDSGLIKHLKTITSNSVDNDFTIVHLLGSHADYARRHPPEFSVFNGKPPHATNLPKTAFRKVNEYDDSLLFSDSVIDSLIKAMDKENDLGCAIYVADHGEMLGDIHKKFGHGFPQMKKAEAEVPFFIWCTDRFKQTRPADWKRLQASRQQPFSTAQLFDVLADLMLIDFPDKQPRRSFLSTAFVPPKTRFLVGSDGKPASYESFAQVQAAR